MPHRHAAVLSLAVLFAVPALAQHDHHHDEHPIADDTELGNVNFQPDCAAEVRDDFDRALAMMHHMMYDQARERYASVKRRDADCAMAYWGVAMTHFQPLWGTRPSERDLEQGRSNAEAALERADSERERALAESVVAFWREAPDYGTRLRRWADRLEAAHEAHPEDEDIAALFALSRLALAQGSDEPGPLHDVADEALMRVHSENPTHPGAIHYMIHSMDIDGRADRHPEIVAQYGEIAPSVPHALHMPSHIYVRTGNWPQVIEWNRRSAEAALGYPAGDRLSMHYIHAQDYIVYAKLQQGDVDGARTVFEETGAQGRVEAHPAAAYHAAAMPARFAVETRDWERAKALEPRQPADLPWDSPLGLWGQSHTWLARGLGAVHTDDLELADTALARLRELRSTAQERGEDRFADYIRMDEHVLEGWIAAARGRGDDAVDAVQLAIAVEDRVEKHPVTPGVVMPPREALGDVLMALERPDDALDAYRASDEVWPNRRHTLAGAARAAEEAGEEAVAREFQARVGGR